MTIACIIRYQLDPFEKDAFRTHAVNLISFVPRCGGHLIGYFMPYEGTNDIAWGVIAFDSLASYEKYRGRLQVDAEHLADDAAVRATRAILHEERNFVELVDGTFNLQAKAVRGAPVSGGTEWTPLALSLTTVACIIRYQIDPFQREGFKEHAVRLIGPVPQCGGHHVGFFLPYEGTNDIAWALVLFESLAAYEAYKARFNADPDVRADVAVMQQRRIILREERNFVHLVPGTYNRPPQP